MADYPIVDHSFQDYWTPKATCVTVGNYVKKCKWCDAIEEGTWEPGLYNKDNHPSLESKVIREGHCRQSKLVQFKCPHCKKIWTEQKEMPAIHNFTIFVKHVDVTCVTDGYDVYQCSRCLVTETRKTDERYGDSHIFHITTDEPTCELNGFTHYTCIRCPAKEVTIIPSLGHTDSDNNHRCDRCKKYLGGDDDDEDIHIEDII